MNIIVVILSAVYAFVHAFEAWMVIRRKRWLGFVFMTAAAALMISGSSFITPSSASLPLLGLSLALVSSVAVLNGYIVLGRIRIRYHALRALASLGLFILGMVAIQQHGAW